MNSGDIREIAQRFMPVRDSFPRPEWDTIAECIQKLDLTDENAAWSEVAEVWVANTGTAVGEAHHIDRSSNFLLLSPLPDEASQGLLVFAERAQRHILTALKGVATSEGFGPHVVLIFASEDAYYQYVAPFYPESGEFSSSSGVHLDEGYGHFVLPLQDHRVMESVIAHELTHAMLGHLPLPRWLNEGIAVNMESTLCPWAKRRLEVNWIERHRKCWDRSSVQDYWSGRSFSRFETSEPSYELAWVMVQYLAKNYEPFQKFVNEASYEDAGHAAAMKHLGVGLGGFVGALLGDGDWDPGPARHE